jgi:hypothetical protein
LGHRAHMPMRGGVRLNARHQTPMPTSQMFSSTRNVAQSASEEVDWGRLTTVCIGLVEPDPTAGRTIPLECRGTNPANEKYIRASTFIISFFQQAPGDLPSPRAHVFPAVCIGNRPRPQSPGHKSRNSETTAPASPRKLFISVPPRNNQRQQQRHQQQQQQQQQQHRHQQQQQQQQQQQPHQQQQPTNQSPPPSPQPLCARPKQGLLEGLEGCITAQTEYFSGFGGVYYNPDMQLGAFSICRIVARVEQVLKSAMLLRGCKLRLWRGWL